jgi:alkylation response protein AidB-like acyl-CoA dehydrogenase
VAALGATNKMFWSEHHRDLMELALDVVGIESQILGGDGDDESWPGIQRQRNQRNYPVNPLQASFFFSRSETIWGGTAEIQRNIVGERVLGLPREPKVEERSG